VKISPIHKKDTFTVSAGTRTVEFQIVACEPCDFCCVTPNTDIHTDDDPLGCEHDERTDIGYDDIGGCRHQFGLIRELVELPLCHFQLFSNLGIKPPRGILIYGPYSCGKTLIARTIANETGAKLFMVNGPEVLSNVIGEFQRNLRRIFEEAAEQSPAIIVLDDIRSIAPNRKRMNDEVNRQVVSRLLTLMDETKSRSNVIVIATTNQPNLIDPALRRFGWFKREIKIEVPDEIGRLEILRIHTKR